MNTSYLFDKIDVGRCFSVSSLLMLVITKASNQKTNFIMMKSLKGNDIRLIFLNLLIRLKN